MVADPQASTGRELLFFCAVFLFPAKSSMAAKLFLFMTYRVDGQMHWSM